MRNEAPDETGSLAHRRNRRRKQAIAGVAGLAVLGAGAYLVTSQVVENSRTETREAAVPAPVNSVERTPTVASSSPSASAVPSTSTVSTPDSVSPSPSPTRSMTDDERIAKARAEARKKGVSVKRPLIPPRAAADEAVTVTAKTTVLNNGSTLRMVSALGDLTGQREHAWAADAGEPVGDARCTQNFHFSNNTVASERPTMLLCWRITEDKSVLAVAVAKQGRPSKQDTVTALAQTWSKLS